MTLQGTLSLQNYPLASDRVATRLLRADRISGSKDARFQDSGFSIQDLVVQSPGLSPKTLNPKSPKTLKTLGSIPRILVLLVWFGVRVKGFTTL